MELECVATPREGSWAQGSFGFTRVIERSYVPDVLPDLEDALLEVRREFSSHSSIEFRLIAEGASRPLQPRIWEEVYLIAHEAISNAFQHSKCTEIEIEIKYAPGKLHLLVRDNGTGMDPQIFHSQRQDCWGLRDMKDRTESIGGRLRVLSHPSAGTEVELVLPGRVAFSCEPKESPANWFAKLFS